MLTAGILTVSDGCARGEREDLSGPMIASALAADGHSVVGPNVAPDEIDEIVAALLGLCHRGCNVIFTTGGTGFSPRDVTPEATKRVIQREAPGIAELLRWKGYQKLDRAVLSRGVCGIAGSTLIVNLPGSVNGVQDGLELLMPLVPHACALIRDEPVDHTPSPEGRMPGQAATDEPPGLVDVIETNIDDLSPEFYEGAIERLFLAGALDVWLTPIQMKKSRPGVLLSVISAPEKLFDVAAAIFQETGSFGLRYSTRNRLTLARRWETVKTRYGEIRIKIGAWAGKDTVLAPEYEDVKAAAAQHKAPARTVYQAAVNACERTVSKRS